MPQIGIEEAGGEGNMAELGIIKDVRKLQRNIAHPVSTPSGFPLLACMTDAATVRHEAPPRAPGAIPFPTNAPTPLWHLPPPVFPPSVLPTCMTDAATVRQEVSTPSARCCHAPVPRTQ
jgi:hypothetical protein